MSKYNSAQKKEIDKLTSKFETRFPNTCADRAKAEVDRKMRIEEARQKKK